MKKILNITLCLSLIVSLFSCGAKVPDTYDENKIKAVIYPEYTNVTVPSNIAPLHFMIDEEADAYVTRIIYPGGEWVTDERQVTPGLSQWKKMLDAAKGDQLTVEIFMLREEKWTRSNPFKIYVAEEEIDPYISYRLISPSYVTYRDLSINQRNITNFDENIIYGNMSNTVVENGQCINCHSYQNYNPARMQFHARHHQGGTIIAYDGELSKVTIKTDSLISNGVYPAWHPTQKLIAYSVNNTGQTFHTRAANKIEVQDWASDLILYDVERNEVTRTIGDSNEYEVFPWWSPDGKYLYYASAHLVRKDTGDIMREIILRYEDMKYNLYRRPYNEQERTLGEAELVFDAAKIDKSATLPRISPDGKFLMFAMGRYGVFHIWHKDADLYVMNLENNTVRRMNEINSNDVESYHSYSSNGRWLIFSTRRYDGNFTRPFIAYIDENGKGRKPFELPQENPNFHREFMKSYNIPEFMSGPVEVSPQDFATLIKNTENKQATQRN